MNDNARLVPRMGTPGQRELALTPGTITIGREPINEITIKDAEISRRHARISFVDGTYHIEDLGSTNGTFVNGLRIFEPTPLLDGTIVDFGETQRYTFMLGESQAVATNVVNYGETGDPFDAAATVLDEPLPAGRETVPRPAEAGTEIVEQPSNSDRGWRRWAVGCGCALIVAVIALGITFFLLDALAPDFLWCTLLRPLTDLLAGITGEGVVCP